MELLFPFFLYYCQTYVFLATILVLIVNGYYFRQSLTPSDFNLNIENNNSLLQFHQIYIPSRNTFLFGRFLLPNSILQILKNYIFFAKKRGGSPSFTSVEPNYNFNYSSLTVVANSSSDSKADGISKSSSSS